MRGSFYSKWSGTKIGLFLRLTARFLGKMSYGIGTTSKIVMFIAPKSTQQVASTQSAN